MGRTRHKAFFIDHSSGNAPQAGPGEKSRFSWLMTLPLNGCN